MNFCVQEFFKRLIKLEVTNNDIGPEEDDIKVHRTITALAFKPKSEFSVLGTSFDQEIMLEVIYLKLVEINTTIEHKNLRLKVILREDLPLSDKICWKFIDKIYPYLLSGMFEIFTFDLRRESFMALHPKNSKVSKRRGIIEVRTDVSE